MQRSKAAVLLLLFSSVALADINADYDHILSGRASVSIANIDDMYAQFVKEYKQDMKYSPADNFLTTGADRKAIFANTVQEIIKHNSDRSNTYKKGINPFSDMTEQEFFSYYNLKAEQHCSATQTTQLASKIGSLPTAWDWRDQGVVSPVKNQGKCGSCWAFSTVGALESHYIKKYGQFVNISEQQLVDCAGNYDNHGCNGGLPSHAFEYIKDAGGITTEDQYAYAAVDQQCQLKPGSQVVGVSGSFNISLNEDDLEQAIFQHGPVSVAYQVIPGFKDYKSGVYTTENCKNTADDVNHAVLAVGYGVENGTPYWIIKNSWGAAWGDNGYFKMEKGKNMCGIQNCNSFPKDVFDLTRGQTFLQ